MPVAAPSMLGSLGDYPQQIHMEWVNGDVYDAIEFRYSPGTTLTITGTDESKTLTGLAESTEYTIDIRGRVGADWSDWSDAFVIRTTLLAPSGLTSTQIVGGVATLDWTNNSLADTAICPEYSEDGSYWLSPGDIDDALTTVGMTGLTAEFYYFRVRCKNTYVYSEYSAVVTASTPLDAPTGLTATALSSTTARLDWNDVTTGETGFKIEQMPTSGSSDWVQITTVAAGVETYTVTGLTPGIKYYWRMRAYDGGGNGAYSATVNATPASVAMPSNVEVTALSATSVQVSWVDNSNNETGFKIYEDGVLVETVAANATSKMITGLTAAQWYRYAVEAYNATDTSGLTAYVKVFTSDPPKAPSGLVTVVLSSSSIRANWTDNSFNEVDFHIERSATSATAGFSEVGTVGANVGTYADTGLASNTQYWYRVRAHNASGYSGYCPVATDVTLAAIAKPTNVTATVTQFAATLGIEIRFTDNSTAEDDHRLERSVDGGGYAEIATLAANRTFYGDISVSIGHTYAYKIRAKQGGSYSSYSDAVSAVVTATPPDAPVLTLGALRWPDKVSLTWLPVTGAVKYRVYFSTDGVSYSGGYYTRYNNVTGYTITVLDASTLYYFKVVAYDICENASADSNVVSGTTPAAYVPTAFESLCFLQKKRIVDLIEVNPSIELKGWALTSGKTYTYEAEILWTGIDIETVKENGVALTEKTSIATVEATAATFWCDYHGGKVYVHTSDGTTPDNFTVIGTTWLYFTNWQRGRAGGATVFNDHQYLPLIPEDGLPDVTHAFEPYYKGSFIATHGGVSFINGKSKAWGGGHYFDDRCDGFLWRGSKLVHKSGGEGFAYADFQTISTGIITGHSITDERFSVSLKDSRSGLHRSLPLRAYSVADFPNLEDGAEGKPRPFFYGAQTNVNPVCIDTVNLIFELMDGQIMGVTSVVVGETTLTADVDYWVDYTNGRMQLASTAAYTEDDILTVAFGGQPNEAVTAIQSAALVFLDILMRFMGLSPADIDLESIYGTDAVYDDALSVKIYKGGETTESVIEQLEKSCLCYSFQTPDGKIGFKREVTTAPSDVVYLQEQRVVDISRDDSIDDVFAEVYVYYDEHPDTGTFSVVKKIANESAWKYGVLKRLEVYTCLTTEANASALGDDILAALNKPTISLTATRRMFPCSVGGAFYLTRLRFYGGSGTANNKLMRITEISKSRNSSTVSIKAQEV